MKSQYCSGLLYTARPQDARLRELLPKWIEAGLIELGTPNEPIDTAKASGIGKVG
jgi:hypothetical protein